jgi:photosystem II stability/assembly factor-like uncharacterized protein
MIKKSRFTSLSARALVALAMAAALAAGACDSGKDSKPAGKGGAQPGGKGGTAEKAVTIYSLDVVDAQTAFAFGSPDEDYGTFVLKTTDGGAHWAAILRTKDADLAGFDFVDANNGVAITDVGAVYTTADGGQTWKTSSDATQFTPRFTAPAPTAGAKGGVAPVVSIEGIAAAGAKDLWAFGSRDEAASGAGGKVTTATHPVVVRSTDGGATWKEVQLGSGLPAVGLRRGFFLDPQNGYAVGGDVDDAPEGAVLKTTDGGATWKPLSTGVKQVPTGVCFADANRGWVVGATEDATGTYGPSQILTTADGGATWQSQFKAPGSLYAVRFADAQNGWAAGGGGRILRTTDGGATWTEQTTVDWASGPEIDADDPVQPEGRDQPSFSGIVLLAPDRGFAAADLGVYEYKRK